MNTKEVLQSIKKLLFEDAPVAPTEPTEPAAPAIEEFKEYSLADGTKVKIDKLEVGGKVMVVTADGTEVKAPEGEHMLSSGEAIEVDAEGLIYEIKSAVAAQPEMMEVQQKMQAQANEIEKLKAVQIELEKKLSNANEAVKQLFSVVEKLADEPGAEPTQTVKEFTPKTAKEERFKAVMDAIQEKKK